MAGPQILFKRRGYAVLRLPDGTDAVVDDNPQTLKLIEALADFEWWSNEQGYVLCGVPGSQFFSWLHRIVCNPPTKGLVVDHINGVKNDARSCNLRAVTRKVNMLNRHGGPKSGVTGLLQTKTGWKTSWKVDGKQHIRLFPNSQHSNVSAARDAAAAFLEQEKCKDPDYVEATKCAQPPPCLYKMDVRYICN